MENREEQNELKFGPGALTIVNEMWVTAEFQDANRREDVFTFSIQRYDRLLRQLARVASDIA